MPTKLLLARSEFRSQTIHLTPGRHIVGRSTKCEVVLDDITVSRRHAEICVEEDKLAVVDLDSLNGTFVDGVRISSASVRLGQHLTFGSVSVCLGSEEFSHDMESTADDTGEALRMSATLDGALLSPGQKRVFELLIKGISEKQIAQELHISPHTVHNHVQAIYRHFKVHSRPELLSRMLSGK